MRGTREKLEVVAFILSFFIMINLNNPFTFVLFLCSTIYFGYKTYKLIRRVIKEEREDKFKQLLNIITKEYRSDRILRDEREFETELSSFLKAKFPKYQITPQYRTTAGDKIDIVVDNLYALELKVAYSRKDLDDCFSKIHFYKKHFDKLAIVVLDIGMLSNLNYYEKEFNKMNVEMIIKKGRVSLRNGR